MKDFLTEKYIIRQINILRHTDTIYVSKEDTWDDFSHARFFETRIDACKYIAEYLEDGIYQVILAVIKDTKDGRTKS